MKVWHVFKYDIFDVVFDFFGNDVFFSHINNTAITIIHKVVNAYFVKDSSSIYCCSVVDKCN